jgi:polar amino acid transport system substrate-binding protein
MRALRLLQKVLFILCSFLILVPSVHSAEQLVIGTGLKPPLVSSAKQEGFLDTVAKEVHRRIGIELEAIILPAKRVLENTNTSVEDGCLLRIVGLEKFYTNLIQVPEGMHGCKCGFRRSSTFSFISA